MVLRFLAEDVGKELDSVLDTVLGFTNRQNGFISGTEDEGTLGVFRMANTPTPWMPETPASHRDGARRFLRSR